MSFEIRIDETEFSVVIAGDGETIVRNLVSGSHHHAISDIYGLQTALSSIPLPFASRPLLVAWIAAGNTVADGVTARVGNVVWIAQSGSTKIADMPGWVPSSATPKHWGAVGDGVANDTAAFQATANSGYLAVVVTEGTYLIDTVVISALQYWVNQGTIKSRTGLQQIFATVDFTSAAAGSSFTGGIIDGNRAVIGSAYSDPTFLWTGIRSFAADFTLSNLTIINTVAMGFWVQGERVRADRITAKSCGKLSHVKQAHRSQVTNVIGIDIGNAGLSVYQHGSEIRQSDDLTLTNWVTYNFIPDTTGREPSPACYTFEKCNRLTISGMVADGYAGTSISGHSIGISFDSITDATVDGMKTYGYPVGFIGQSCQTCRINSPIFDGKFADGAGTEAGVILRGSGLSDQANGVLSLNGRANSSGWDIEFHGAAIKRFVVGVQHQGMRARFIGGQIIGCTSYPVVTTLADTNGFFPAQTGILPSAEFFGMRIAFNGSGVRLGYHNAMSFIGCDIFGNGQDDTLAATIRAGIYTVGATTRKSLKVNGCRIGDAAWATPKSFSFFPGATDGSNQIAVSLIDPSYVELGQWVTLVNGSGAGNLTGRIVDLWDDTAVLQFAAPATLSETGNLTTLSGTASSNGATVTGVGTHFDTELHGRTICKIAGNYYTITRAETATTMIIAPVPTVAFTGQTVQIIAVDASYAARQNYGMYFNSLVDAITCRGNDLLGNTISKMVSGSYTMYGAGSEIFVETADAGVTLNTAGASSTLLSNFPISAIPIAARAIVRTAITGTDAVATLEFRNATGLHASIATLGAYAVGTKCIGSASPVAGYVSAGNLSLRFVGGTDAIPSGGAVKAECMFRIPDLADSY